jgi:hypothetical protein
MRRTWSTRRPLSPIQQAKYLGAYWIYRQSTVQLSYMKMTLKATTAERTVVTVSIRKPVTGTTAQQTIACLKKFRKC